MGMRSILLKFRTSQNLSLLLQLRICRILPLLFPSLGIDSFRDMFRFFICIRIASIGCSIPM